MPPSTRPETARIPAPTPPSAWPNDMRVAVWLVPRLCFAESPVTGWDAYGQRAGLWRLMDTLDRLSIRASLALPADQALRSPDILEASLLRDWDILALAGEHAHLTAIEARQARSALEHAGAPRVAGWLCGDAGLDATGQQYLAEADFSYVANLNVIDLPRRSPGPSGTLIELPLCEECSDQRCLTQHGMSAVRYARRIADQFTQLYAEGAQTPSVLGLPLQPALVGSPGNLREFEAALADIARHDKVWLATGREIAHWVVHGRHAARVTADATEDAQ